MQVSAKFRCNRGAQNNSCKLVISIQFIPKAQAIYSSYVWSQPQKMDSSEIDHPLQKYCLLREIYHQFMMSLKSQPIQIINEKLLEVVSQNLNIDTFISTYKNGFNFDTPNFQKMVQNFFSKNQINMLAQIMKLVFCAKQGISLSSEIIFLGSVCWICQNQKKNFQKNLVYLSLLESLGLKNCIDAESLKRNNGLVVQMINQGLLSI